MDRRSFLRGVVSVLGASIALPVRAMPCIWGDGINDDAPGLNALLAGDPVNVLADDVLVRHGREPHILGGRFLLRSTVRIAQDHSKIIGSQFIFEGDGYGCMLDVRGSRHSLFQGCHFRYGPGFVGAAIVGDAYELGRGAFYVRNDVDARVLT